MIFSPEEAKEFICPVMSGRGDAGTVYCQGPKCMAWRWTKDENPIDLGYCGLAGVPNTEE